MLFKSLLTITPLIVSVFSLQDCCYEDVTDGSTSLKYRSNALEGIFYDVPANENDGSGSFCGVEITRDANDQDNCAAATLAGWDGYCDGVDPKAVECTSEFKVRTSGSG